MANITGSIPFLGIPQVRLTGEDLTGNFVQGVQLRQRERQLAQEDERMALARQQEERLQFASALDQQVKAQQLQVSAAQLKTQLWQNELAVKGFEALPGLLEMASKVDDWSDISPILEYGVRNAAVMSTPFWQSIIKMNENALDNKARLDQAREATARALEVAGVRAESAAEVANIRATAAIESAKMRALEKGLDILPQGLYRKFSEEIRAAFRDDLLNPRSMEDKQAEADRIYERYRQQVQGMQGETFTPAPQAQPSTAPKAYVPGRGLVPKQ